MEQTTLAFLENLGLTEWLIILFIVLLLFGAPRLPDLGRSMARGLREFKDGLREGRDETDANVKNKSADGADKDHHENGAAK